MFFHFIGVIKHSLLSKGEGRNVVHSKDVVCLKVIEHICIDWNCIKDHTHYRSLMVFRHIYHDPKMNVFISLQ